MNDPLWKLEGVTLSGRLRPRLDAVSLEIPPGVTAILGPSGAGKSSLLNLLVGFERPDVGKVMRCSSPTESRLPLFWGPPDEGLWPHMTAGDHLRTVMPTQTGDESEVRRLLLLLDLSDKIDSLPDQLSQGERARLAVARALAADAGILVLDEPLIHVEPARVGKYWDVIDAWRREHPPVSVVFSTHAPEVAIRQAEHVFCLNAGRVAYAGSIERLYASPPTQELGWSLGPINWIAPADSAAWLGQTAASDRAIRPEQLSIAPAADSPLVVETARSVGSVAEIDLLDERNGSRKRFYHRPQGSGWRSGDRVVLQLLMVALLCIAVAGCDAGAASELPVHGTLTWAVPAEGMKIPTPRAVHATEAGDIYVLDNAGRVLVYDRRGQLQRQWWMPDYSVGKPEKILLLRDGRLAVADTHYHRVVFFNQEGEVVSTMGTLGHEPGQFVYTVAVAEDDDENLYVGEYGGNDRVQKFDKTGKFLLSFGSPGTERGQFQRPSGIAWHKGRIYVVDAFNNRVQVFSESGELLEVLGNDEGALHYPYDIAFGPADEFFVVEYGAGRVSKFDLSGRLLGRYGSSGSGVGQFSTPWGMTVDSQSRVFVADTGNRRVVELEL